MLDQVFELFISLNATDEQLDFPFVYCSAKDGYAKTELEHASDTMEPLFDAIIKYIPPPRAKAGDGFQILVANLDYSDYLGRIAFGKILAGKVKVGEPACCLHGHGKITQGKITMIYHFEGLKRIEVQEAHAGESSASPVLRTCSSARPSPTSRNAARCLTFRLIRRRFRWNLP